MQVTEREMVRLLQMLPAPMTVNADSWTIAVYPEQYLLPTMSKGRGKSPDVVHVTWEKVSRYGEIVWALNV